MSTLVTFYGPKGTSDYAPEVATVARLLARDGARVLVVNWNLDQPSTRGLVRNMDASRPGLLDLLLARVEGKPEIDWRGLVLDDHEPNIAVLPSGQVTGTPPRISWPSFYADHEGGEFLERLRNEWSAAYDTILIYCPAGADEEGVCTVQMADVLVWPFELDHVMVAETVQSVRRRQEARQQLAYDRMPLRVIPVPSGTGDRPEDTTLLLHEAAILLAHCFGDWLPGSRAPRDALEFLRFGVESGHIEQSCQLISRLIQADYRNATELIPAVQPSGKPLTGAFEELARAPLSRILETDAPWHHKTPGSAHAAGDSAPTSIPAAWETWALHQRRLREKRILESSRRMLGEEHADTLAALRNLIATLSALGAYQDANLHASWLEKLSRQMLGEEHPDTLAARDTVAGTLRALGNYRLAHDHEKRVLEVRRRVLGKDHPDTLAAQRNLSLILRDLGEYWIAHTHAVQALESSRRELGEEHPDTIASLGNLADTLRTLGAYSEARRQEERVLEMSHRVLGELHPGTITAMANLATTLYALGDYRRARQYEERVLAVRHQWLGEDHPDTLSALSNLSATLRALGAHEKAREYEEQVLQMRRQVLGEKHPDTITAMSYLAATLFALRRYQDAYQQEEEVVALRSEVLGRHHPDTLLALGNLSVALLALGDPQRAYPIADEVLAVSRRVLGEEHPTTRLASNNLTAVLDASEALLGSQEHSAERLKLRRRTLPST